MLNVVLSKWPICRRKPMENSLLFLDESRTFCERNEILPDPFEGTEQQIMSERFVRKNERNEDWVWKL